MEKNTPSQRTKDGQGCHQVLKIISVAIASVIYEFETLERI